MVYFKENPNFSRFQGSPTFSRWVRLFPVVCVGVQLLIAVETYETCDFQGGIRTRAWTWL